MGFEDKEAKSNDNQEYRVQMAKNGPQVLFSKGESDTPKRTQMIPNCPSISGAASLSELNVSLPQTSASLSQPATEVKPGPTED